MTTRSIQTSRVSADETRAVFEQERSASGGKDAPVAIGNVVDAVVKFTPVEDYTTFLAEYAFVDSNIILHFFPAREQYVRMPDGQTHKVKEDFLLKWQRVFPQVLSPVAMDHFRAGPPVLVAQYVPELFSWYLRAGGFADRLDASEFTLAFLEKLDRGLDAISFVGRPSSS